MAKRSPIDALELRALAFSVLGDPPKQKALFAYRSSKLCSGRRCKKEIEFIAALPYERLAHGKIRETEVKVFGFCAVCADVFRRDAWALPHQQARPAVLVSTP